MHERQREETYTTYGRWHIVAAHLLQTGCVIGETDLMMRACKIRHNPPPHRILYCVSPWSISNFPLFRFGTHTSQPSSRARARESKLVKTYHQKGSSVCQASLSKGVPFHWRELKLSPPHQRRAKKERDTLATAEEGASSSSSSAHIFQIAAARAGSGACSSDPPRPPRALRGL